MKLNSYKRIPGVLLGILFVCTQSAAASPGLVADLFDEGEWTACRREALRAAAGNPDDAWAALYFHAAGLHGDIDHGEAMNGLRDVAEQFADRPEVSCTAHFHLGLDAWSRGDPANAWRHLSRAFAYHEDEAQYKLAGCMLFMTQWDHPEVVPEEDADLVTQLRTMRPLWTRERIDDALVYKESREQREAVTGRPGKWIVSFYRANIGPAIGNRCSLEPSCSEYYLRASRQYGLRGIAMIGDRLVREPGVVSRAEKSVFVNGRERIYDPIEDHVHD